MGIVDLFQHQRKITDEEAERLRGSGNTNKTTDSKPKGITIVDVLAVFPGAKVLPRTSEAERWLEAMGVPEAGRKAISEEAARWTLKHGTWQRTVEELTGPYKCKHCGDDPHAKVVRRTWHDQSWGWICRRCGREVKS